MYTSHCLKKFYDRLKWGAQVQVLIHLVIICVYDGLRLVYKPDYEFEEISCRNRAIFTAGPSWMISEIFCRLTDYLFITYRVRYITLPTPINIDISRLCFSGS